MTSTYQAQRWARNGKRAKEEVWFADFAGLLGYVAEFKTTETDDLLGVHLPSRAADAERQQMIVLGATPN